MTSKARGLASLGNVFDDGALSNRNLIINGAMQVAQRGTSEAGITAEKYSVIDRWRVAFGTLGTWTGSQDSNAPEGFSSSLKVLCTTADASPASGDYAVIQHRIEAQNLQQLAYGASSAKVMTLSFWVKSNKTGTASLDIIQHDNSYKSIYPSYTINSADTWEFKTIQIAADTSGVINNDSGLGIEVSWWINSGSSLTGGSHTTSWAAQTTANRNASNLGVGGATNDYFQITGVQLEVGDTATPFEHRSYGQELALCQRYYQVTTGNIRSYSAGIDAHSNSLPFMTEMRGAPSASVSGGTTSNAPTTLVENIQTRGARFTIVTSSSGMFERSNTTVTLDAEL
jgi:hypothetical protein